MITVELVSLHLAAVTQGGEIAYPGVTPEEALALAFSARRILAWAREQPSATVFS